MGYHDANELPNYWKYARDYVLQDHLFEPNASWSLPQHLFMVSEWSAWCKKIGDPMSCINELRIAGLSARLPLAQRSIQTTRARPPGLRLDRSHVSACTPAT